MSNRNATITSQCRICARIFYDTNVEKCPRCNGLCWAWPSEDERLMSRYRQMGDRSAASAINVQQCERD